MALGSTDNYTRINSRVEMVLPSGHPLGTPVEDLSLRRNLRLVWNY